MTTQAMHTLTFGFMMTCLGLIGACGSSGLSPNAGNLADVQQRLAGGAKIDDQDGDGFTLLMKAATNGHADAVRLLLERGAVPAPAALVMAAENGRTEIVQLLVDHGAKPPANALANHRVWEHPESVALFLQHGADPNGVDRSYDGMDGVLVRGTVVVANVINFGGGSYRLSMAECPPIWIAALDWGHVETARLMLKHGAHHDPLRAVLVSAKTMQIDRVDGQLTQRAQVAARLPTLCKKQAGECLVSREKIGDSALWTLVAPQHEAVEPGRRQIVASSGGSDPSGQVHFAGQPVHLELEATAGHVYYLTYDVHGNTWSPKLVTVFPVPATDEHYSGPPESPEGRCQRPDAWLLLPTGHAEM